MQYIKIELERDGKDLKYPDGYNDLVNFVVDHLYIDEKDDKGEIVKTFLCLAVRDGVDHKKLLKELDKTEGLTKEEMIKFCEPHEVIRETITDEARVKRLAIKVQLGRELTPAEEKALDPEDDTPGFGLSKRFVDRI